MDQQLSDFRSEIDEIDRELRILYKRRFILSRKIGEYKKALKLDVFDEKRETEMKLKLIKEYIDDPDLFAYVQLNEIMLELSRGFQDE